MKLIRPVDSLPEVCRGGAVAVGNFDGVHRGHALIIERLVQCARDVGGPAVVFTFDPHPARLLHPEQAPMPLSSTERKAELLAALGVDAAVIYPTDRAFLELGAEDFFRQVVVNRLAAKAMVEGTNFTFGRDRQGDVDLLAQLCRTSGVRLEVVGPVSVGGQPVSSSRVRRMVAAGNVEQAAEALTQPYRIRGLVEHGAGRGRQLGYPTANVGQIDTLLPAQGIYAGRAWFEGQTRPAAISLGPNPTFNDGGMKFEAYLLDFNGDLYDREIHIDFLARLRDVVRYGSVDELLAQMALDVEHTHCVARPWGAMQRYRVEEHTA